MLRFLLILFTVINLTFVSQVLAEEETPVETETTSVKTSDNADSKATKPTPKKPVKIEPPIDLFSQTQKDLKHYLPNKTESLLIGTEEFVTIFKTSNTANNKGVFILIPDWQQSLKTPKSFASLMAKLPDLGWATLAIQPINKPNNYPSTALKQEDALTANQETLKQHKEKLSQVITALLEKVANLPGTFVLVSAGNHAGLITNILAESDIEKPNALILLSAYIETDEENQAFAKNLANSELPTLDLVLKKDNNLVLMSAKLREKQATKALKVMYRQHQVDNFRPGFYPENNLLKAIQGWLKFIGW